MSGTHRTHPERTPATPAGTQAPAPDGGLMRVYDQLLTEYMPPALLVDERHQLLHVFGSAHELLQVSAGRVSTNVTQLLRPALRTAAASALQRCEQTTERVRYAGVSDPKDDPDDRRGDYVVSAQRVDRQRGLPPAYLLRFEQVHPNGHKTEAPDSQILDAAEASRDYIRGLEADLQFTRENLQATIEELETSNEELQAANEELVASNEELQSTNEELNSVNEELNTVNAEHQLKIAELIEVTEELDSLLRGSDLGILFVDDDLQIKRFTPSMARLLRLRPEDKGRNLADFSRNIASVDLQSDVRKVLAGAGPIDREIRDSNDKFRLLRILPHPSAEKLEGALLTLFDIDRRKRAEMQMHLLSSITEHARDAILAKDPEGTILAWNHGAERLYGFSSEEAVGRSVSFIVPDEKLTEWREIVQKVMRGVAVIDLETVRKRKDGTQIDVAVTVSPVRDTEQRIVGASAIARDISDRKRDERARHRAEEHKDSFLAMLSHELRNPLMGLLAAAEALRASSAGPCPG